MRKIVIVLVVAALAWSAYWAIGAGRAEEAAADWFAARTLAGRTAAHGEIRTIGFPNRFDTTIYRPRLGDPETGMAWEAAFVQILRLSYKPEHAIVVFPENQQLTGPDRSLSVASERMQASVVLDRGTDLELSRGNLVADGVSLGWEADIAARLDNLLLAVRQSAGLGHEYDVGAEVRRFRLDPDPLKLAGTDASVLDFRLDATLQFDVALSLAGAPLRRPLLLGFKLNELEIMRGARNLRGQGEVSVDSTGALLGTIDLSGSDWRALLQLARETGAISQEQTDVLSLVLADLNEAVGQDERFTASIRFSGGKISVGDVELGPSPRMPLR